jgi:predicted acetylornithine/succinylornithine family transaminase
METAQIMKDDAQYVMGVFARAPMVLVKGQGAWVWDSDGRKYLDFFGGLAVNVLGHCHPAVATAIQEQAASLIHCSNLYHTPQAAQLAKLLASVGGGDKLFFCNSGAEANEGAIKLTRKYAFGKHGPDRYKIITTLQSFHGRTLATLAATGQTKYQQGFAPIPVGFVHVPFNDLKAVEEAWNGQVAGVIVEPIQGEGGVNPASPEYLRGLRKLCDERGALLIFDEIQTGMGRTGAFFAWQDFGVKPDIVTMAKGLGGGVPIGAFGATDEVAAAFKPGDHGSTFGGNPLAAAAAYATVRTILEEGLPARAAKLGEYLMGRLAALKARRPEILEVRGKGLMVGAQLSFPGKLVVEECRRRGLLINCTENTVLRMLPPLIIEESLIDQAVSILDQALATAQAVA